MPPVGLRNVAERQFRDRLLRLYRRESHVRNNRPTDRSLLSECSLHGAVADAEANVGMLITTSPFTPAALESQPAGAEGLR